MLKQNTSLIALVSQLSSNKLTEFFIDKNITHSNDPCDIVLRKVITNGSPEEIR